MKRISDMKGENAKDKAKETSALTLNWSERDLLFFRVRGKNKNSHEESNV